MKEVISRNRENGWPDLEPPKKAFVYYYLEDYNHREAAQKSGFSANHGIKLLREPLVAEFLKDMQEIMAERSAVSRDFINFQWMRLLPMVMGEEEVAIVNSKDGYSFMAKEFNAAAATKVLTELSKSTNFYADGSGSSASVTVQINLGAMGIKEAKGVTIENNNGTN